jgi:hypothetical protein
MVITRTGHSALAARTEALASPLSNVAWSHESRDEEPLAQSMLEERAEIGHQLVKLEPDELELLRELVVSLDDLGDLHRYREEWDPAVAAHRQALGWGRRLVARQPDEPRWRETLCVTADKLGHAYRGRGDEGDLDGARAAEEESREIADGLAFDPEP